MNKAKELDAVSIPKNGVVYTRAIQARMNAGYAAILLTSTNGNLKVELEVSINGTDFYTPVDSTQNDKGVVVVNQEPTNGNYILYTPVIGEYIRFKVKENNVAATVVSLTHIFKEG